MGEDKGKNNSVHDSAIIEGDVTLEKGVKIGPFCHIIGPVEIGEGTSIGSYTYIRGPAEIGSGNRINPHCIIGTEPESRVGTPTGSIVIGNNNVITELTVIQRGTGERNTEIGNNNFLMDNTHIAHDNRLFDDITIAPNTVLAGHVVVQDGATIGIGASVHQHTTIGAFSMIGMNSTVTKDVPPFSLVSGTPAIFMRWNTFQLEKMGMGSEPDGDSAKKYRDLFLQLSRREEIRIG